MIEGPTGAAGSKAKPRPFAFGRISSPFGKGLGMFRGPNKPMRKRDRADLFLWQLQMASRAFWVVLGGLALYLVVDMWMLQPSMPLFATQPVGADGATPIALSQTLDQQAQQAADYRAALALRNPFRLVSGAEVAQPSGGQTVKNRLIELAGELTVVGINRGRVPEALIEDATAKRTHFVKVGDEINGLKISAIDERGVTVTYEGEETTLQ
jgi:hypothetical protein